MEIQGTRVGSITVMTVSGRMDVDSSGEFEKELNTVIEAGARTIAVDLKGLDYISSAGLRAVLSMTKILKGLGGELLLCSAQGPVKDVFLVSGFSQMLPWFDSVEEAVKSRA